MGIVIFGKLRPLGHDLVRAVGDVAVFLGKDRSKREDGVRHTFTVFLRVGHAAAGKEGLIYVDPDVIGVDKGAVKIENIHEHISLKW